ncbi:MAG TPA: hypothetical protein GX398_05690 [Candidatus Cloacimonetes bacterium]|nr:hypothetical protein [Candidatus Cloacimonadota bacterium]
MLQSKYLLLLLTLFSGISLLSASPLLKEENIALTAGVYEYKLAAAPIIAQSELIQSTEGVLSKGIDYQIDYRRGIISFLSLPQTSVVLVSYILVPPSLSKPKQSYQIQALSDSLIQNIRPTQKSDLFQGDGKLLINGSKTFAVSFGDEGFDVLQSLYVKLSGEIMEGVSILAQLSDSESKLTPEGDSKELSSLDQVFIKLKAPRWALAMGDLDIKHEGTRYMDYYTRFEGIDLQLGRKNWGQVTYLAGGGESGRCEIHIIDGKQGPYYLNPGGEPGSLLVVAGSETVYINGVRQERGSDYYIDYAEGSLMFNRMVYSTDKVSVWFKYTGEYYPRHTFMYNLQAEVLPGFSLLHRYFTSFDSKDNPLVFDFTPEDLQALQNAGDSDAWSDGASLVEPGQGLYRLVVDETGFSYYEYALGDSLADYMVIFSYVGPGNGDYEQFSPGKYRFVGIGLGEWIPQKKLVAPKKTGNLALRAQYQQAQFDVGVEGVFSGHDQNTLSRLDNDDNLGGILYGWLRFQSAGKKIQPALSLEAEKRWAKTVLMSDFSSQVVNYDQGNLLLADSLAMENVGFNLAVDFDQYARPSLSMNYVRAERGIRQYVWRMGWQNKALKYLPASRINSTITSSSSESDSFNSGTSMSNAAETNWARKWLKIGGSANQQGFKSSDNATRDNFLRLNPFLELGDAQKAKTHLAFILDKSEHTQAAQTADTESQTYVFKQQINTLNHNLQLEYNHREYSASSDSTRSRYDLINHRSSNSFLNRALVLIANYQLNQTEFYPRIRELQYIGHGLGTVDSTGVITPNGDWDWAYVTSSQGSLSSENNLQASLYIKPANILSHKLLSRINSDISIWGTLQRMGDKSALPRLPIMLNPDQNDDKLIQHNQNYQQNIWIELLPGKMSSQLSWETMQNTDNRYQDKAFNSRDTKGMKIDLNRVGNYNFSLQLQHKKEEDSRYGSKLKNNNINGFVMRNFGKHSIVRLDAFAFDENGTSTTNTDEFRLWGIGLQPGYRGGWAMKGRFSSELKMQYNFRDQEGFLSFLPEKRGGFILGFKLNMNYRINEFSTISLDYSLDDYPKDKIKHQLKLEFRAEL